MTAQACLLEVEQLTKRYPRGELANDAVDLEIGAGEVFGLLGPNGAGKTTLVGQLVGLLRPTSGSIRIGGIDVVAAPAQARRLCSYQPQATVALTGLTPMEAVELAGRLRGGAAPAVRRRAGELLDSLDLGDVATSRKPASGGVARLVAFCMAAVVPGAVVILDEPTNDVDPLRRRLLWRQVRSLADDGRAVLLVTHNVLEAERCVDRLAILHRGRVAVRGTPADLRGDLHQGVRLEVVVEPGRTLPAPPEWIRGTVGAGGRIVARVDVGDVARAVEWADATRRAGLASEFLVAPTSLEDVYIRAVADDDPTGADINEDADAAFAG